MKLMFYFQNSSRNNSIIRRKIEFCIPSCSAPNEPSFESPGKPWQGLKGKNPKLQHQSEQFCVAQKPRKGAAAFGRRPTLYVFFAPKILRTAA